MTRRRRPSRRVRSVARLAIPITPLIDAVFLLLVYFLLVGEFRKDEAMVATDLSALGASAQAADPYLLPAPPITLTLASVTTDPRGYVVAGPEPVGAAPLTPGRLRARLGSIRGALVGADQRFILRPDAGARWEHAVAALALLDRAGFTRVRLDAPGSAR